MLSPTEAAAWESALREGVEALGFTLTTQAVVCYRRHFELVREHNARAGLTTITDPAEAALKHYADSLSCLLAAPAAPGEAADIGSGAGFPGLVLAVARPEVSFTLLDSSIRRTDFLRAAAAELGLPNVTVVTARAEEAGRDPAHRERHGWVMSRAVAPLAVLLEYGLPLTRAGGRFVAMKGPEAEAEVAASANALAALGGEVAEVRRFALPRGAGERALVVVAKTRATPARYPRRPGTPAKRPL